MPHVNQLIDEFGEKGFAVVGVTHEPPDPTEKFMQQTGAKWMVAYVPKGKTFEEWGVSGIPAAFLVDPNGTVVWSGHPAGLRSKEVAKYVRGVRYAPDLSKAHAAIETLVRKGEYGEAYAEIREALDGAGSDEGVQKGLEATRKAIEDRAACSLGRGRECLDEGDAYGALKAFESLAREYEGLPAATEANDAASKIRGDATLAKEVEAGQGVYEGLDRIEKGSYREAWKAFAEVRASHAGTAAAKRAASLQDQMKEAGQYGFNPACRKCKRQGKACDDCRSQAKWPEIE